MPKPKNTLLRALVPIVGLIACVGIGFAIMRNTGTQGQPQPSTPNPAPVNNPGSANAPANSATGPTTNSGPAVSGAGAETPKSESSATKAGAQAANPAGSGASSASPPASPLGPLVPKLWTDPADRIALRPLGDMTPGGHWSMKVEFSQIGAGIESLTLADQFEDLDKQNHEVLQREITRPGPSGRPATVVPFALLGVTIEGEFVNLAQNDNGLIWREIIPTANGPAGGDERVFEAVVLDASATPVARVHRRYSLSPDSFDLILNQTLENLTSRPLAVEWRWFGPVDLPASKVAGYGGDMRRMRFGYLTGPTSDPDGQVVLADRRFLFPHPTALGTPVFDVDRFTWPAHTFWPDATTQTDQLSLAWAALTNRYFAVAMHAVPALQPPRTNTPTKGAPDKRLGFVQTVSRVVLDSGQTSSRASSTAIAESDLVLSLQSPPVTVEPGPAGACSETMGIYAGPLWRQAIDVDPTLREMGLGELVIFIMATSGPCVFCTFQWLATFLHGFLSLLHGYVVFDWALSIMLLVVCVRTLLHPITRWSQTSLQRFSKQMAGLAPKQAKLKEKFANDPKRLREETARLMQEEKVNYAGALGCLPMFLQTPVWIALYAMIFFSFELRHTPAFFGVFQAITGGHWLFLADLAEPDAFVPLPQWAQFTLPLIGTIHSFNILPLVLGLVFFIQQKYLTPAPSATMTPEQQSQQKMMKVMSVIMFPVFMYNAPAALTLYFMVNSSLGILESRWIRSRMDAADAAKAQMAAAGVGTSVLDRRDRKGGKAPVKPPGLFERIRQAVERQQREAEKRRKEQDRNRAGPKRTGRPPRPRDDKP